MSLLLEFVILEADVAQTVFTFLGSIEEGDDVILENFNRVIFVMMGFGYT